MVTNLVIIRFLYRLLDSVYMAHYLIEQGYIPLDKSWIIRMGLLDIINGSNYTVRFLKERHDELGDDLKALYRASVEWKRGDKKIHVGESATLYRFFQFLAWKQGINKKFIPEGTLVKRVKKFCHDPDMVNWSLEKLLTVEGGTTQRASASILCGNTERIEYPPHKVRATIDAVKHWYSRKRQSQYWKEQHDLTLLAQAIAYKSILKGEAVTYAAQQAESYCFARAFDFMTKEQGEKWPSLKTHESSRIEEMEKQLQNYYAGRKIDSKDHRVVQAIAMLYVAQNKDALMGYKPSNIIKKVRARFRNPDAVNKSWLQFWKFMEYSVGLFQK